MLNSVAIAQAYHYSNKTEVRACACCAAAGQGARAMPAARACPMLCSSVGRPPRPTTTPVPQHAALHACCVHCYTVCLARYE